MTYQKSIWNLAVEVKIVTQWYMLRNPALIPLSQQHHNGLSLCVLTERALQADRSIGNVGKLARRAVDRYEIELSNHFAIEEEVLFPLIEKHLQKMPIIAELVSEHRAMEAMIGRLRTEPSTELLQEFCALLGQHIRREERDLFEQIQQRLPEDALAEAGKEIDARAVRVCL